MSNVSKFIGLITLAVCGGCAHNLEIRNLYEYQTTGGYDFSKRGISVDLECATPTEAAQKFCEQIGVQLSQKGGYHASMGNRLGTDVGISCEVAVRESAKASNFFVSWPGFILFTHAWLGYGYEVDYSIRCRIVSPKTGEVLATVNDAMRLHLRYADFGTTWMAGCGWLFLYSAPAAVNGLFVMSTYDQDITPELYYKAYPTLAAHVVKKIVETVNGLPEVAGVAPQRSLDGLQVEGPVAGGQKVVYDIVYCRRNANQEFSYEFDIKLKDETSNSIGAFRSIQREFRNAIKEDYTNAFSGIDDHSLRIDFPEYEQKDGHIKGRAVVLTISVVSLSYDPDTCKGTLAVKVNANQYEEARAYIRKNIETLARDKNIALITGEIPPAAKFYLGREELKDGNVLEIEFKTE